MGILRKVLSGRALWAAVAVGALLATATLTGARGYVSQSAPASPTGEPSIGASSEAATVTSSPSLPATATAAAPISYPTGVRNVVLILADDLDTATFQQVSRLKALHRKGLTLRNMVVTDSLCCPSRASILRSQYVHNHGVLSNLIGSGGGWATFAQNGDERDCLPVWLQSAGVQTAFIGKYLNGYGEDGDPTAIPPGWDRWFVPTTKSGMYRGYGYTVNDNGRLKTYAVGKDDFLPDVVIDQSVDFLQSARSPFYLQVNSTSPHDPAPVSPHNVGTNLRDHLPRTKTFNVVGDNAAPWRGSRKAINHKRLARYDSYWRQRVQSTESIADTVEAVTDTLAARGLLDSTLIVVTSDNGFHAASRRLPAGKRTPYREDTVVPTIVIGPGITPGTKTNAITSMIDLGPTFAELLGAKIPAWTDGHSLVPLFGATTPATWRTGVISESLGRSSLGDPDYQTVSPPTYTALRTERWLYVEYEDGSRELFNREQDPAELNNVVNSTAPAVVDALSMHLHALAACKGDSCRSADSWADGSSTTL
jgi:arylsulfatase A-like enzyme